MINSNSKIIFRTRKGRGNATFSEWLLERYWAEVWLWIRSRNVVKKFDAISNKYECWKQNLENSNSALTFVADQLSFCRQVSGAVPPAPSVYTFLLSKKIWCCKMPSFVTRISRISSKNSELYENFWIFLFCFLYTVRTSFNRISTWKIP